MPTINKIRLTNVLYEDGDKRFNDELFNLDGQNTGIVLENGGGKTVFIHTVLQAILPHTSLGERRIRETLKLDQGPAHIAIEWIVNERPRRYVVTAVSLFIQNEQLDSYRYVYEYGVGDSHRIEEMPFAIQMETMDRPASKDEIREYYQRMSQSINAKSFDTLKAFREYIEDNYYIIHDEWKSIVKINEDEGGIEKFFEQCRTTMDLYDRLLIPVVEDSIVGHDKHTFADTFEKQRESFQKYHELQKNMEEHRLIQEQLEEFVREMKNHTEKLEAYDEAKQHAKGLLEVINEDEFNLNKQWIKNEAEWETWESQKLKYELKKASFKILKKEKKVRELEKEYQSKQNQLKEHQQNLIEQQNLYDSLLYARSKKNLLAYKQKKTTYKEEMKQHDKHKDVEHLKEQLNTENAKLHGYYLRKIEGLKKEINDKKLELRPLKETKEELQKKKNNQKLKVEQVQANLNKVLGKIESEEKSSNDIKRRLKSHEQENIKDLFMKWTERQQEADEELIQVREKIKHGKQQITFKNEKLTQLQDENNQLQVEKAKEQAKLDQIYMSEEKLIEKLARIRPNWQSIADIYLQQMSISNTLEEKEKKHTKNREQLLAKEQLALRFVSDYNSQDIFISDPFLAKGLKDIQNQFYVESGTDYYGKLSKETQDKLAHYQLWPITLITTNDFKEKLLDLLKPMKEQLQYPVTVLTTDEVLQMETKEIDETWLTPKHWKNNLSPAKFKDWKQSLQDRAKSYTKSRQEVEVELEEVKDAIRQFQSFFNNFPEKDRDALEESLRNKVNEIEINKRKVLEFKKSIEQINRKLELYEEQMNTLVDENNYLTRNLELAQQYFQIERSLKELQLKREEFKQKAIEHKRQANRLGTELRRYEETVKDYQEDINELKWEINSLMDAEQFRRLRKIHPIYTEDTKEVIQTRREKLQLQIHGIEQGYGELKARYEECIKNIEREEQALKNYLRENEQINIEMTFPIDGERKIEQARTKRRELKESLRILEVEVLDARSAFDREDAILKQHQLNFNKDFPSDEIYVFKQSIQNIKLDLQRKEENLKERRVYLTSEKDRITKELENIRNVKAELNKYEYKYTFNNSLIRAIVLTENERKEYRYARLEFAKNIGSRLEKTKELVDKSKDHIEKRKNSYRRFINRTVTDHKLRRKAQEGIDTKTSYDEVLEYQRNMKITLERSNEIARSYIKQNDELIQAFITNMHNHLTTVVEQLKVIPRHTRVKVEDKWKEIYRFNIPEWTEEDGKSRLREYMEWIVDQLEMERFKDEQGNEDPGKMRKEIETWLDTRQLLQVVMKQKMMGVSCRKVTNDNKVSTRLTTWEQSNRWSGGEMWSKNMTLFLGILNYVAEKRQHYNSRMKRHRAVILDNPFGKASSDHVLNPVFFIAEQLGFQIIALTAHADGKFLQDYFPVIYSLRLRPASDGRKQIVEKTKSLHYAYFQDNDPEAIERLAEREQLELFT